MGEKERKLSNERKQANKLMNSVKQKSKKIKMDHIIIRNSSQEMDGFKADYLTPCKGYEEASTTHQTDSKEIRENSNSPQNMLIDSLLFEDNLNKNETENVMTRKEIITKDDEKEENPRVLELKPNRNEIKKVRETELEKDNKIFIKENEEDLESSPTSKKSKTEEEASKDVVKEGVAGPSFLKRNSPNAPYNYSLELQTNLDNIDFFKEIEDLEQKVSKNIEENLKGMVKRGE